MNQNKTKVFLLPLVAFVAVTAFGNDWYFSPDGNDDETNAGNVRTSPRKSVTAWFGKYRFRDGDNIYLLPGTHEAISQGYHGENWLRFNFIGIDADGKPAARGSGEVLDWMDENAKDLAGNARLRDGKVDMGCYQCWLDPTVGTMILFR